MKRSLAVLALATLAGAGGARAQTPPAPAAKPASVSPAAAPQPLDASPLLQALLKDITLTPQQQHAVDSIRVKYMSRLPSGALTAPDSATIEKTRELLAQGLEAVREVLDAHQKNVWDHNVANEMTARMRVGP